MSEFKVGDLVIRLDDSQSWIRKVIDIERHVTAGGFGHISQLNELLVFEDGKISSGWARHATKEEINAWELINKLGGLQVCTKITFSKRVHKPDAKYFIQNPENKTQVQFFLEDEARPDHAMSIVDLQDAIQEVTGF